jgi:hypothetical protein
MRIHTSHQTIRLSRGSHVSVDDGACVMELASILAGEPFNDHPECVSPVIGAFLRLYNDALDDARRQDLYPYAASVVGTRAFSAVETYRAERCRTWAWARAGDKGLGLWIRHRLTAAVRFAADATLEDCGNMAARVAVECVRHEGRDAHARALALVDELVAVRPRAATRAAAHRLASGKRSAISSPRCAQSATALRSQRADPSAVRA